MSVRDHNNPSSTFYWKDYENDEGLRISSLPAQGLWMRLLCVAAKAEPFGYVLVNGYPLDATGVARLASVTEGEATALVEELERNGVFSRDRKGRMFSRRMVREAARSAKNKKNGQKGGNPALKASLGNPTEKSKSDNPPLKGGDKPPYPFPVPNDRESKLSLEHPPVGGCSEDPDRQPKRATRFDEFWRAYPHRGGRKKGRAVSEKRFAAAVKRGVAEETIIAGARSAKDDPDVVRGYARDPATWLSQEGWRDEIGGGVASGGGYWTSMGYIPEAAE